MTPELRTEIRRAIAMLRRDTTYGTAGADCARQLEKALKADS